MLYIILKFLIIFIFLINNSYSNEKNFQKFLYDFSQKNLVNNYDNNLIHKFLKDTNFIKRVVELDRSQPEFKLTLDQYLSKVISKSRIKKAKIKLQENITILRLVEKKFKVQPRFIVALWGIETDFGRYTGSFSVISSLATLVYDGRREKYFKKELINALKIIKSGHIDMENMKGSWAGAMGQCQFMPSSFINYAYDWDNDGKKDIWKNKKDVFASAANYLSKVGWDNDTTWGRKVYIKEYHKIKRKKIWLTINDWKKLNVLNFDKTELPYSKIKARLISIDGNNKKHYFLVYNNFESLLKWNRSNYFGVAVGTLSDKLKNDE